MVKSIPIFGILLFWSTLLAANQNNDCKMVNRAAYVQTALQNAIETLQKSDWKTLDCYKLGKVDSAINNFIPGGVGTHTEVDLVNSAWPALVDIFLYCGNPKNNITKSKVLGDMISIQARFDQRYTLAQFKACLE